jgi:outer membrane protein
MAENKALALDRSIARAALLPTVVYHNQFLYTQSNTPRDRVGQGTVTQSLPLFIANNAVHEYTSQGSFGLQQLADVKRANAASARASTELEVVRSSRAPSTESSPIAPSSPARPPPQAPRSSQSWTPLRF